jgi:hypothetical protein|tara:strand:+ start:733 stop:1302 length:570 start_codon:yes stop_codon:yes gene_type:complete
MKITKSQLKNLIKKELQLEALGGNPMSQKIAKSELPQEVGGLQQQSLALEAQLGVLNGMVQELAGVVSMAAQASPEIGEMAAPVLQKLDKLDNAMSDASEKAIKDAMNEGCAGNMAPAPYVEEDPHESHGEGRMAKSQLYKTAHYAQQLHNMIEDGEELDAWIQAKITKASDYLSSVKHHLEYRKLRGN